MKTKKRCLLYYSFSMLMTNTNSATSLGSIQPSVDIVELTISAPKKTVSKIFCDQTTILDTTRGTREGYYNSKKILASRGASLEYSTCGGRSSTAWSSAVSPLLSVSHRLAPRYTSLSDQDPHSTRAPILSDPNPGVAVCFTFSAEIRGETYKSDYFTNNYSMYRR